MTANADIGRALQKLTPGAQWSLSGDTLAGLVWLDQVIARPTDSAINAAITPVMNIIPFPAFIQRWTDAEYALLMQKRAAAITAGTVTMVKQWDTAATSGSVDLNTTAAQNFKAAMVSNAILTQARADIIFS